MMIHWDHMLSAIKGVTTVHLPMSLASIYGELPILITELSLKHTKILLDDSLPPMRFRLAYIKRIGRI